MSITNVSAQQTTPPPGFWMPTNEQLKSTYGSIAEQAMKSHTAKRMLRAPRNASQYPKWDITPQGAKTKRIVYEIRGELYLRLTRNTILGPVSRWYKCGPAPLF